MSLAEHLFGKYAFQKCLTEHLAPNAKQQLINKSLFTALSVLLAEQEFKNFKYFLKTKVPFEYLTQNPNLWDWGWNLFS